VADCSGYKFAAGVRRSSEQHSRHKFPSRTETGDNFNNATKIAVTLIAFGLSVAISVAGTFLMWSSVVEDLVDRLIPEGGKGLLGKAEVCRECEGRGYTRKNQNVWQTCHKCYAGRCWIPVADNHKVSRPIP
jgi:hypothetical protein